jgi:hypothetical protein
MNPWAFKCVFGPHETKTPNLQGTSLGPPWATLTLSHHPPNLHAAPPRPQQTLFSASRTKHWSQTLNVFFSKGERSISLNTTRATHQHHLRRCSCCVPFYWACLKFHLALGSHGSWGVPPRSTPSCGEVPADIVIHVQRMFLPLHSVWTMSCGDLRTSTQEGGSAGR